MSGLVSCLVWYYYIWSGIMSGLVLSCLVWYYVWSGIITSGLVLSMSGLVLSMSGLVLSMSHLVLSYLVWYYQILVHLCSYLFLADTFLASRTHIFSELSVRSLCSWSGDTVFRKLQMTNNNK